MEEEKLSLAQKTMRTEIVRFENPNKDVEINAQVQKEDINNKPDHSEEYFANENKILKSQISFCQNQINLLQNDNFIMNQKYQNILQENSIYKSKIQQQENQLDILNTTINNLNTNVTSQENEINQLNQKLSSNISALQFQENSQKNSEKQIFFLNQQINDKNMQITDQNNTSNALNAEKQEFERKISQLNNELTNINLKLNSQEKNHQLQLNKVTSNLNFCEMAKNNLDKENSNLNQELTNLKKQILNDKSLLEKQNETLQNQNDKLNEIIKEKESCLDKKDFTINTLEVKVEDYLNSFTQFKKALTELKSENIFLKQIINDKENEIKNLYQYKEKFDIHEFYDKNFTNIVSYGDIEVLREELKKIGTNYTIMKRENELLSKNNTTLTVKLNELLEIKNKFSNISNENSLLIQTKKDFEKLKLKFEDIEQENKHYRKTIDILIDQNKNLLFNQTIHKDKGTFIQESMSKEKYEKFIYDTIDDLNMKLNENIKLNLKFEEKEKKYLNELNEVKKENEEIKGVMMQMEEYTHEIEEINNSLKKENDLLKNDNIFSPKNNSLNEQSFSQVQSSLYNKLNIQYNELVEKEKTFNITVKDLKTQISNEKEKNNYLTMENQSLKENSTKLNNEILDLKKTISNSTLETTNLKAELHEIKLNAKLYENQLLEVQNLNKILLKDKEELNTSLNDMKKKTNETIEKTKLLVESNLKTLNDENTNMKTSLNSIESILKNFDMKGSILQQKDSMVSNNEAKTQESTITQLIEQKKNEFNDNKKIIEQQKICIENLNTENSMLKYQMSLFKTNQLSMSHNDSYLMSQNLQSSLIDKKENINKLEEEYLKGVVLIKELQEKNKQLEEKNDYLKQINMNMINQDVSSPYKFLMFQLEELSKEKANFVKEKEMLLKEKDDIIKNYSNINLTNEQLKIQNENLQKVYETVTKENSKLQENLNNLFKENEEIKKNLSLIEQKNIEINSKNQKIVELTNIISKIENDKKNNDSNVQTLKTDLDVKKREVLEAKSKAFNNFYVSFKNSKKIISYLSRINNNLQEQLANVEGIKNKYEDKISNFELEKTANEKVIKEKNEIINSLQVELSSEKEKNKNFEKDIKILTTEKKDDDKRETDKQEGDKKSVLQTCYNKMFLILKKCPNMINFLNTKVSSLEKENMELKQEIEQLKSNNVESDLKLSIKEKDKMILDLNQENQKLNIKTDFLSREINSIGNYVKSQIETSQNENMPHRPGQGPHHNIFTAKKDYEKHKSFSMLIIQMRKALKIINYLMNNVNVVPENKK